MHGQSSLVRIAILGPGALVVSVFILSACVRVTAIAADAPVILMLEPVVGGLDLPLDIAVRPAFPSDIVVAEQVGRLRIVRDGELLDAPLLDLTDAVTQGYEQGLLGVAPHPDPADDRVFVYYTDLDARQVVASFVTRPGDHDRLDPDSEVVILTMEDQFGNHNGGGLAFGPDGYLYIATGDGGGAGDPLGSGRDQGSLLGKILRIDVDIETGPETAYAIPPDNPFVDVAGARPEIWHTGLRNPFRFRFDAGTGDLWIGDVGQGSWEEVNLAPGGVGGLDFGWNLQEGSHCFAIDPCDGPDLTLPVAEYGHDQGCTVIGGTVYRGSNQPLLEGWYVFADHCSGRVFGLDADEARTAAADGRLLEPVHLFDSGRSISAIAPGPDGELYATDLGGTLLHIAAAPAS
jgi:glucose/arabinose dehydrogenase